MRARAHGIAAIPPYPMPREDELPEPAVSWVPEADRAALLIHDMQRYFLSPFPAGQSPTIELTTHVRTLRDNCAELGVPVAYTAQPGGMSILERGLLADFWGAGMSTRPADRRIPDSIAPRDGDGVFTKWRYSAFHRTGLLDFLHRHGRDQLVICGVYAHVGCLMTANDAFAHDVQPFLAADAIADFSQSYHRLALTYAAERCAATPTTRSVLTALRAGAISPRVGR